MLQWNIYNVYNVYNGLVHDVFSLYFWKLNTTKYSSLTALFIFLVPLQKITRSYGTVVSCPNTRACKQVNNRESIFLSCKICWILLSQNVRKKKLMTTFAWMSVALWPLYNWRYEDLSMSRDRKVMTLLPPMKKCPMDFNQEVFLLPKFDNSNSCN